MGPGLRTTAIRKEARGTEPAGHLKYRRRTENGSPERDARRRPYPYTTRDSGRPDGWCDRLVNERMSETRLLVFVPLKGVK